MDHFIDHIPEGMENWKVKRKGATSMIATIFALSVCLAFHLCQLKQQSRTEPWSVEQALATGLQLPAEYRHQLFGDVASRDIRPCNH